MADGASRALPVAPTSRQRALAVGLGAACVVVAALGSWFDIPLALGAALLGAAGTGWVAAKAAGAQRKALAPPRTDYAPLTQVMAAYGYGVWDYDIKGRKIEYSDQCAVMLGYDPREIDSELSSWGMLVHADDLPQARQALDAYLAGDAETYKVVVRLRAKDGQWREVVDWGHIVERDPNGTPTRAVGLHRLRDVAPPGADALRSGHAGHLIRELDHALVGLLGHAELAAEDVIARCALRCSSLGGRLRTAIGSGTDPAPTDLVVIACSAAEDAEAWAPRRASISVYGGSGVEVVASESVLREVTTLLIDEAVEAIGPEGGDITVQVGPTPRLTVTLSGAKLGQRRIEAARTLARRLPARIESGPDHVTLRLG